MPRNLLNIRAEVVEAQEMAKGVRLIRMRVPIGSLRTEPGAHVTFSIPKGQHWIERSYSVVDDGQAPDLLTIAVKLEPNSRGGSAYMWSLGVGDGVSITGNGNSMPASFAAKEYILLAGGIGITPMTGLARSLARSGKKMRMIYCARSAQEAAFIQPLHEMLGDRLQRYHDDEGQFLDIPTLLDGAGPDTVLFMCGPQGLMNAVKQAWHERNLPLQNLRYETFANSGSRPSRPFEITVAETGRTIAVGEDETLLEALLASGHQVLSDCRRGECGLCKLQLCETSNDIDHRDVFLSENERAAGDCLCACVSRLDGGHANVHIDGIRHGRVAREGSAK
jgi:dimethylamine monooxygenase subunit B